MHWNEAQKYLEFLLLSFLFQNISCGSNLPQNINGGIQSLVLPPADIVTDGPAPCTTPRHGSTSYDNMEKKISGAMEFVQHVEFLSFRKMIGVEYLARFSSCLIEKGLEKVENW
jgi:hypothetical protein